MDSESATVGSNPTSRTILNSKNNPFLMDFNDINLRINRIFQSIWEIYDTKIENHYQQIEKKKWNKVVISISFNKTNNESTIYNKVFQVISNLAKLKDHFKNKFVEKWFDKNIVENSVNQSKYLQRLIDLDNAEKHGYPLKCPRSIELPNLKNITTGLSLSRNQQNSDKITEIKADSWITYTDNIVIWIFWQVHAKDWKFLCELWDLIDNSLQIWEKLYKEYLLK